MLDELTPVVAEQMRAWAIPGVSMGLLADGQVETAVYGIASIATNAPVTPKALFQIGSISKIFTKTEFEEWI